MSMAAHAGMVLHAQWNELKRLRKMALKKQESESIHDLRVASRRIRATLQLFAPFIPRRQLEQVNKRVRRLTRQLGRLRNIDEAANFFFITAQEPDELAGQLKAARKRELAIAMKNLKNFPHKELDPLIKKFVSKLRKITPEAEKTPLLPAYFSQVSIAGFQKIHNLTAFADDSGDVEAHHRLRIAIKKFRYRLETVALIVDKDYNSILEPLKEYQTLLGRMNDMAGFAALCDSLKLGKNCRSRVNSLLDNAKEQLFSSFSELLKTKPLHYTFIL